MVGNVAVSMDRDSNITSDASPRVPVAAVPLPMKPPIQTLIIITPGFPGDENDTTCLPAQQQFVRTLNRIFPEMRVIVFAIQYPLRRNEYSWWGNRVIPFDGLAYWKVLRPLLWQRVGNAIARVSSRNTALLSFWFADTALIGKRIAQRYNLRHRCWIMGQDARKKNPYARWVNIDERDLIALSDSLAEAFFRNHGKQPGRVIPLGIDTTSFEFNPAQRRPIHLLGVGSLIQLKQYDVFVDVVAALKATHPTIRAVLCGKGPEESRIRKKIRELNLEEHIVLAGEVSHNTVLSMMQQSRILLHPSSYEGYSSACLEALYAGCHVISFTRAENRGIDHWHIVSTIEEMNARASALLEENDFTPVLVHTMEKSAWEIIKEFMNE